MNTPLEGHRNLIKDIKFLANCAKNKILLLKTEKGRRNDLAIIGNTKIHLLNSKILCILVMQILWLYKMREYLISRVVKIREKFYMKRNSRRVRVNGVNIINIRMEGT